jgi:hypothetical protein
MSSELEESGGGGGFFNPTFLGSFASLDVEVDPSNFFLLLQVFNPATVLLFEFFLAIIKL